MTAAEMRAIDKETIEGIGLPGALLMENAGRALAIAAEEMLLACQGRKVGVICGAGNNGGDGFVAARVLQEHGIETSLYLCAPFAALRGDAQLHANAFLRCGGHVQALTDAAELGTLREEIRSKQVLIDALFGTGLARAIGGHLAEVIDLINEAEALVLSADLPSGLSSDDGATLGVSVRAERTIAMGCAKVANVGAPGFASNGELSVAEIGIPRALARARATMGLLERADVRASLQVFTANMHKGGRGHVLAVAGSQGKRGAGRLAALAALRAGAGLVTLASVTTDDNAEDPVMTAVVREGADLEHALAGKSALLMGPGMSTDVEGQALVRYALEKCALPMLLDADALNHLAGDLDRVATATTRVVLTPHPGEAARLLQCSTQELQADRIAAVRELARRSQAVVVLKGARTCICDGRDAAAFVAVNPSGGPELSTAGTGDVLSGVIASLLAQGVDACMAARAGAYWHGEAGRLALLALGGSGVISSDLLLSLPAAHTAITA